jgi:Beta-propeller repeat
VDALGKLAGKSNYFIGSLPERWHAGISNYAKVRYRNVYRGVDMIYYGNQRQLEYDFVIRAGADPGSISLEFQGAGKAELGREGGLVMHTDAGDLRWHKPLAYQEVNGARKLVACAYAPRDGQQFGFTLGAHDAAKPLIIDPVLEYSTYLGGSNSEQGNGIAVDAHGSAYVTGITSSPDFPTENAFQKTFKGGEGDAFVTKFNAAGELVYSTYLGGSRLEFPGGIAVDIHGNAYVTGITSSPDFPTKNAFQQIYAGGSADAFVAKFDADGDELVYSTYLGGSDFDEGNAIAVDSKGEAYITGEADSSDFPTKNAFEVHAKSPLNAFVAKFDVDGDALVYSSYLGGSGINIGYGIALDAKGSAYVTGETTSPDFPIKNAFQSSMKSTVGGTNVFVTKFDADGDALVYSTYLGGSIGEVGGGIAVDNTRHAYITGNTSSTDFPIKNAFQPMPGSPSITTAFITKFDADGDALVYSSYLGGTTYDGGIGIAVDAHGNAYVTGFTSSTDFPTKNAFQDKLKSSQGNAFVTKISAH